MSEAVERLRKVSTRKDTTVLLTGETGAGKEVAAKFLHDLSVGPCSDAPFIPVDCVALPSNLVESLLFGHEKGAFTGADKVKEGAFFEAGRGTIFLDEIGELDAAIQGKFLRVLETRRYQRVGSVKEYLAAETARGAFRFDLYQRLTIFPVDIPPLRRRGDDVLLLADHFLKFFAGKMKMEIEPLSKEFKELLSSYDFPGNVRELKNIIERAVILADDSSGRTRLELKHLPERILTGVAMRPEVKPDAAAHSDFIPGVDTLESLEMKMIRHALAKAGGVKTEAAKLLGISRFQLLRRMDKYKMTSNI